MTLPCNAVWRGKVDYAVTAEQMLEFTNIRGDQTADEIWLLEHPPVYTLGTSCNTEVAHNPNNIPVVKSSRGGQITYHAPGQLVAYLLLDIKRMGLGPKRLVQTVEGVIIQFLSTLGLSASRRAGAPGVYIDGAKIAALGLRIRNGKCFHGLSLNVDMDLSPFEQIDPCGIAGLEVTQLTDFGIHLSVREVGDALIPLFAEEFGWEISGAIS